MKIQEKQNVCYIEPQNKRFDDDEIFIDWVIQYKDDSEIILPIRWNTTYNAELLLRYEDTIYRNEEWYESVFPKSKDAPSTILIDMLYQWVEDNEEILEDLVATA